ncbi:MAG: response regulator [Chloroflexota bacterium]|nr:response regulator [Chloroflexota bacterium]
MTEGREGGDMDEKARILIVDDNVGMCETLSDIMEDSGYRTAIALDGYDAIQKVKEAAFDIIFMDIRMAGMDGVETFKRIKKIHPETAVVMMTGYAVEDLVREALREGAYGVLYKPFDIEKMIGLIEGARRGGLILVVDDDPDTCATFKDILEAKGYKVATALNGEEAVEVAQRSEHDVIFIDMKLPTINGLETYLAIREINPQVVAVMMTGYRREMGDLVEEALNKDAYACLYKPFDVGEVIQLVDEICRRKRQRGEQDEVR